MGILSEEQIYFILQRLNAIVVGSHVVYTSGKHGSAYVNKDAIYPHTRETSQLCREIAHHFHPHRIEVVLGPAVGGVILSQWVAHHLTRMNEAAGSPVPEVIALYADKTGNGFELKRGYDKQIVGRRTLVVEDIFTTGGSAKQIVELARESGAELVGLGGLCNRGGVTSEDVGNPPMFWTLTNVKLDAWEESRCPLCVQNIPINTSVGHGKEFLDKRSSA